MLRVVWKKKFSGFLIKFLFRFIWIVIGPINLNKNLITLSLRLQAPLIRNDVTQSRARYYPIDSQPCYSASFLVHSWYFIVPVN